MIDGIPVILIGEIFYPVAQRQEVDWYHAARHECFWARVVIETGAVILLSRYSGEKSTDFTRRCPRALDTPDRSTLLLKPKK